MPEVSSEEEEESGGGGSWWRGFGRILSLLLQLDTRQTGRHTGA